MATPDLDPVSGALYTRPDNSLRFRSSLRSVSGSASSRRNSCSPKSTSKRKQNGNEIIKTKQNNRMKQNTVFSSLNCYGLVCVPNMAGVPRASLYVTF